MAKFIGAPLAQNGLRDDDDPPMDKSIIDGWNYPQGGVIRASLAQGQIKPGHRPDL
jgi:hypothetical protein